MTERAVTEREVEEQARVEQTRDFLCGYQLCMDMLNLRKYERKRAYHFDDPCQCEDLLLGSEAFWRARMHEVAHLINSMRNGREKLILYYHYIAGESIERAADLLGVSRRTGYRIHKKGLIQASYLLDRIKKYDAIA